MRTVWLRAAALAAVILVPLRIIAQGFLPGDDALRHVAKAVSGRPWTDVLLLRPGITLDSNPGWHTVLGFLHSALGLGTVDLLIVSVVGLFVVLSLGPVLLLRRPEAWLLALVAVCLADPGLVPRYLCGRPFLLTSAIVPVFCLLWPRLEDGGSRATLLVFGVCAALSTWIHGSYYLLALPVLALLLASRWRAALRLAGAFAAGILGGAVLTGHPLGHLWQMLLHGYLAVGLPRPTGTLVTEFQPTDGHPVAVLACVALLVWRAQKRPQAPPAWRDPAVVLAASTWALGFVAARFWTDWSAPALASLAAVELEAALERHASTARATAAALLAAAAVLLLSLGADVGGRWSDPSGRLFLSARNPTHAPWLPQPGGIAYSAEMGVFYGLFFSNPDGPWKYVLGFEPAIMPPADYAVFCEIKRSKGATEAWLPWLQRMRPQDRLYVVQRSNVAPSIPGLEWFQPVYAIWAGRLPAAAPAAPPAAPSAESR